MKTAVIYWSGTGNTEAMPVPFPGAIPPPGARRGSARWRPSPAAPNCRSILSTAPKPRLPSPGLTPRAASAAGAACAFARRTPSPARPNTFSRLLTPTAQDARFVFPPVPWTASRCRIPTTSGITTMPGVQGAVLTPRRRGLPLKMTPFTVARRQTPNPR